MGHPGVDRTRGEVKGCILDSTGSLQGSMAGFCDRGKDPGVPKY